MVTIVSIPGIGDVLTIWDRVARPLGSRVPALRRHLLARQLRKLRCRVQISQLEAIVGRRPQFVRQDASGAVTEHVYVLPDAYVQAVTDPDGVVQRFAVTTRSPNFHPTLGYGDDELLQVELGRTPFSDLGHLTNGVVGFLSARRFGYAESVYLGNRGRYLTYVLAHNDAGYVARSTELVRYLDRHGVMIDWFGVSGCSKMVTDWMASPDVQAFRAETTINTYAVFGIGPHRTAVDHWWRMPFGIGPDRDEVRPLDQ